MSCTDTLTSKGEPMRAAIIIALCGILAILALCTGCVTTKASIHIDKVVELDKRPIHEGPMNVGVRIEMFSNSKR